MKILTNQSLKKYTTIKIGGIASSLYIPESLEELVSLIDSLKEEKYYLLAGGSNLLINDNKIFKNVINLREFNKKIIHNNDNSFYVGASVRLQKLISFINEQNFGGIEYLYSVPGTVGGAVYMNAGRGKIHNKSISDYIVSVDVFYKGEFKQLSNAECLFDYRTSIFKSNDMVILGVKFMFDQLSFEQTTQLKNERLMHCKLTQDNSKPNFGSVFSRNSGKLMNLIRKFNIGFRDGIRFSNKTSNWFLNENKGTFKQAICLINFTKFLHKIIGKKIVTEVIIWD